MSTRVQEPSHRVAAFVTDHTSMAIKASGVGFTSPGFAAMGAALLSFMTNGRVRKPLEWFYTPKCHQTVGKLMKASAGLFVGSLVAHELAQRTLAKSK